MRKMSRTSMIAAAILTASISQGLPVQASMIDNGTFTPVTLDDTNFYTVSAPVSTDPVTSLLVAMSESDPAVCPTSVYGMYYADGKLLIEESDFIRLSGIEDTCEAYVAANLPNIVPEGTPMDQVPAKAAAWEASAITYDENAAHDYAALASYQNAESGFLKGKGICATYATAFNTLVQSTPIDPATGLVSYACAEPVHYKTRYIFNKVHAWSAVSSDEGKSWHFYDVTFYDGDGEPNRPEYLDMGEEQISDSYHSVFYAFQ